MRNGAALELTRCDLAAGKGADGAKGETPSGAGQGGADAPTRADGCIPSESSAPVANTCGGFVSPTGDDTNGKGREATFLIRIALKLAMKS
jgi:hypothetical protein